MPPLSFPTPSDSKRVRLLVSVGTVEEALLALSAGADLIDAKNPDAGALGALPAERIAAIRNAIAGRATVTAVIGDHRDAASVLGAADRIAATGVDMVKIGLYPELDRPAVIAALGRRLAATTRLVAVLAADLDPPFELIPDLAKAGFAGVMLDTEGKQGGLLTHQPLARLAEFIALGHAAGLMTGLAGSLRVTDIPVLAPLGPDLLGFRGGLCEHHDRRRPLLAERIRDARTTLTTITRATAAE